MGRERAVPPGSFLSRGEATSPPSREVLPARWCDAWAVVLWQRYADTRATIRCRTNGFVTTCCAPARRAFKRTRTPSCSLRRATEAIERKRGLPLRYFSTSKPSILGRCRLRKRRSAGPCWERKRSASSESSKQATWWPSRWRMTSRILRVVGEVSSTIILNCPVTSVPPSCFVPVCVQPPSPVSTVSIACLPHALLMSVHRAHTPAHDSLTAFGHEGMHTPATGEKATRVE